MMPRLCATPGGCFRCKAHALPAFGNGLPQGETLRAVDGRLERADAGGTARYTLRLLAEYTEVYKEDTP